MFNWPLFAAVICRIYLKRVVVSLVIVPRPGAWRAQWLAYIKSTCRHLAQVMKKTLHEMHLGCEIAKLFVSTFAIINFLALPVSSCKQHVPLVLLVSSSFGINLLLNLKNQVVRQSSRWAVFHQLWRPICRHTWEFGGVSVFHTMQ